MSGRRIYHGFRARYLGRVIRAHRQATGMSLEKFARAYGWSPATMSRTENGWAPISSPHVAGLLTLCQVPMPERVRLIAIAKGDTPAQWWVGTPAEHHQALHDFFDDTVEVLTHAPASLPPELRTPDYAAAAGRDTDPTPPDPHHLRALLDRPYSAYLHEAALHHIIGDPAVITAQLEHLVTLSHRGNVTLRVIPFRTIHPPMTTITLYRFQDQSPIVHLRSETVSAMSDHLEDTEPHQSRLEKLDDVALSEADSRIFITTLRTKHHHT